jgi:hypothetical protein
MTIDSLLVGGGLGGLVGGQLAGRGWRAAKEEEEGGGSLLLGLEAVLGHLEVGGGLLLNLVGQGVDLCVGRADSCFSI